LRNHIDAELDLPEWSFGAMLLPREPHYIGAEQNMSATTTTKYEPRSEPLWFLHNLARILVDGEASEDRFSVVDMTGARGDMPPLHVHHDEDETFYVIDGELELYVAGREPVSVQPGQAAFAPRGVPHAYRITSSEPTHWLVACTGTSFARLVRDTSLPATTSSLPVDPQFDPHEIAAISAQHGIEILGPPGTLP
jgi:quercetin dioxygenase-like cupin family protein